MYCVVVRQRVIGMVFELRGGVAACYWYVVCTEWLCGRVLYVWCVYCVVVWQRVIGMVCVLCGGVAACYRYGVCTELCCGSVS